MMLRRFFVALLAVALLSGLAIPHQGGQGVALAEQGFVLARLDDLTITATRTELNEYDGHSSYRLYLTVDNRTGETLGIFVNNSYLDGMEVDDAGMFDLGPGITSDDYVLFLPYEDRGSQFFSEPSTLQFELEVNGENYRDMYYIPIRLNGEMLAEINGWQEEGPDITPPDDAMLPIEIFDGAYIGWQDLEDDKFKIRVQVRNCLSVDFIVTSFKIYMYATDIYGNRIYGDDIVYYGTTETDVEVGETVYSDYITVPKRSQAYQVYLGVKRAVLNDGKVFEVSDDDVEYWYWTLE